MNSTTFTTLVTDLNTVGFVQGVISLVATLVILVRVTRWDECLGRIKTARTAARAAKEQAKLEQMRQLLAEMQSTGRPPNITSVLDAISSDEEIQPVALARRKRRANKVVDVSDVELGEQKKISS